MRLAERKLVAFGLNPYLDFDIGECGEGSVQWYELVAVTRAPPAGEARSGRQPGKLPKGAVRDRHCGVAGGDET